MSPGQRTPSSFVPIAAWNTPAWPTTEPPSESSGNQVDPISWVLIDTRGDWSLRVSQPVSEYRTVAGVHRWSQSDLERDLTESLDPTGALARYGGRFGWVAIPEHCFAVFAVPSDEDPIRRAPNLFAETMYEKVTGEKVQIFGAFACLGSFDFDRQCYRPFTKEQLANLRDLHCSARITWGSPTARRDVP